MAENGSAGGELTPKQWRAVRAMLATKTVAEAAQLAKVGERTLARWLTDPTFRQALSAAEGDLLDAATRRLLTLQDDAINTFESMLATESTASDSVKLRAAQGVIDTMLKLRELRDLEQRLTALEQAMATQQQAGRW